MQTPKTRVGSIEVPQRAARTARQLKTGGADSESVPSPQTVSRTPKERSPKVIERKSPRSPASEKKRPGRVVELELQLGQLQEELKKAKDQLSSSETIKKRAQQEAEEAKKQLAATSAQLEESQQQLQEISASEEARLLELRKISQDRDRAWESELEAVQKHHSMDSAALTSAVNEIHKLKNQIEHVTESEESSREEIRSLQLELTDNLSLVEYLKSQLNECKESESRVLENVEDTLLQLETAKKTEEALRLEGIKAIEVYEHLSKDLEGSKLKISSLEELISMLKAGGKGLSDASEDLNDLKTELMNAKSEASQLKLALEGAERRYQEEYIQSTLQIRSAYELAERTKSESVHRENELVGKLKIALDNLEELKAKLMDIEDDSDVKVEEKQPGLEIELKKAESYLIELKSSLSEKETELHSTTEENEKLKLEIKRETERSKANDEAVALAESARASEREALMKLGYMTEETDKSNRKMARVTEQLEAAQVANSEMEAELRKLKVQSDQWRKAAEAAAAILSGGGADSGKFIERTGSLDNNYHTIGAKLNLPYSDEMDDISPKKKNGNMLKKIGVLLKKGSK